mmetsp:Transcript_11147/g.25307  ORF Transcript_11147/g.25307 Transcript_11147/m.25307 type:complete len:647 (+) Transcript_11147:45-1985(+)
MHEQATTEVQFDGDKRFSCPEEVAKRIAQLYGDERLADVTFVVQGADGPEQRFLGHRNIVSTWSRPLNRMLCGGFAESIAKEVWIREIEPAAFETMLKLMYCGVADITEENVLAVLDVSVRFDVAPLVQFCVQFLQSHTSSEHACRMLEIGVQYGLSKLIDKCIDLIVTDDHILESEDFHQLSQAAVMELAKHDSWNMHEDDIYDAMVTWSLKKEPVAEVRRQLLEPILEHLRYPHMSVEKLRCLSKGEVHHQLIFDALFFKLHHEDPNSPSEAIARCKPRSGSLLFSWLSTAKVTVSGDHNENARHTSSNGFTGVRGDRRMQHGTYSWTIDIAETQSSWIFVGISQADDFNDVAWRSSGRMLYCLDSRFFHQGSGQNHPNGDRKICSGDCIRIVLDCSRHTAAFGINNEKPRVLFRDLPPVPFVPAVDLRDCGDKVRILSSKTSRTLPDVVHTRCAGHAQQALPGYPPRSEADLSRAWREGRHLVGDNSLVIDPSDVLLRAPAMPVSSAPDVPHARRNVGSGDYAAGQGQSLPFPGTAREGQSPPIPSMASSTGGFEGRGSVNLGHPHIPVVGRDRMSQPRQSQGSQGSALMQDRGFSMAAAPIVPYSIPPAEPIEEEGLQPAHEAAIDEGSPRQQEGWQAHPQQ